MATVVDMIRVLIVRPGEAPVQAEITDDLEIKQELVGGLIQAIAPFDEPVALLCNDEGELLNLPPNRALRADGVPYDIVAGTFFLCGAPPDSDRFTSLTDEQIARYTDLYRWPEVFIRTGNGILCIPMEEP